MTDEDAGGYEDLSGPDSTPFRDEMDDRERGISPEDRIFLLVNGRNIRTKQSRINTRSRIRRRIRAMILDFELINKNLSDHDRRLVFRERGGGEDYQFEQGLKHTIQFLYRGIRETDGLDAKSIFETAIHNAEQARLDVPAIIEPNVSVDIDEQPSANEAYKRFTGGESLTAAEIGTLLISGQLNDEEQEELVEHAQKRGAVESSVPPGHHQVLADLLDEEELEDVEKHRYALADLREEEREAAWNGDYGPGQQANPSGSTKQLARHLGLDKLYPEDLDDTDEGED